MLNLMIQVLVTLKRIAISQMNWKNMRPLIYAQNVSMEGQATLCYYYKNGISSGTWSCDDSS